MANWELVYVDNTVCDLCDNPAACNIYRRPWGCKCLKCSENGKLFRYLNVCAKCWPEWIKELKKFDIEAIDYGD